MQRPQRTPRAHDAVARHDSVDSSDGHRCGICGKAFERRDLRDRHKRRCTITFAKPKRSKRRSCLACAVSKLGCDQGQPSCRRCTTRNINCEYVGDADGDGQPDDREHSGSLLDMDAMDTMDTISITGTQQNIQEWHLDIDNGFPFNQDMGYHMSPTNGDGWLTSPLDKELGFAPLWRNDNGQQFAFEAGQQNQHALKALQLPKKKSFVMSADAMVSQVQSYLPMMTSRDTPAPPFIHDQIYRCNEGDVKEPIARVMICINAYNNAMPSGRAFVYDMIDKERDALVKSFVTCRSDIDMLATLHAMTVLQVLGFFSGSVEQTRSAELHHPFLLKMVRRLTQKHRQELLNNSTDSPPCSWKHWTFIETLRRTTFLVHVLNVMSARLQKQDPFFYEALDHDLVLGMPLPAATPLWEANQEGQWLSVRSNLPQSLTTGSIIQQEFATVPETVDKFTIMVIASLVVDDLPSPLAT